MRIESKTLKKVASDAYPKWEVYIDAWLENDKPVYVLGGTYEHNHETSWKDNDLSVVKFDSYFKAKSALDKRVERLFQISGLLETGHWKSSHVSMEDLAPIRKYAGMAEFLNED